MTLGSRGKMRSAELARLTGVSVRALRHYHQLGILPEPERSANGYREYSVRELVRVLRLRHLQSAGFSLEAAAAMLDREPDEPDEPAKLLSVLDEVDQDLERRIAELSAQRALIAQARAVGTAPDLPANLLRFAPLLVTASPRLARSSREQLAYLAHVEQLTGTSQIEPMMERLGDPATLQQLTELGERLEHLEDGDQDAIAALVQGFQDFIGSPAGTALTGPMEDAVAGRWNELVEAYGRETFNRAQAQVFDELERRLAAPDQG